MKLFKQKSKLKEFSEDDLALIRMMPSGAVGGGMVFPSGLKTRKGIIILTDDLEENVELCRSILQ